MKGKKESKPVPLGGRKRKEDDLWGAAKPISARNTSVVKRATSSRRNQPSAAQKRAVTQAAKNSRQDEMYKVFKQRWKG